MSWIFIAICGHFFWSLSNVGDKYLLNNRFTNPYVYLGYFVLFGTLSIVAVPFIDFFWPAPWLLMQLILAGVIYFLANLLYYRAIQIEEVSRINIWWSMVPLFSLGLSFLITADRLSALQLVAVLLLIAASIVGSLHGTSRVFTFSKALPTMMVCCFLLAVFGIIFHEVTAVVPVASAFIIVNVVMSLCLVIWFITSHSFRQAFISDSARLPWKVIGLVFLIDALDRAGIFFNYWALSLNQSSLVFAMEATQALFVFIIVALVGIKNPRLLSEQFNRQNIIFKISALVLMVIGIIILAVG